MRTCRLTLLFALGLVVTALASAQNVVVQWNNIASSTVWFELNTLMCIVRNSSMYRMKRMAEG